MRRMLIAGLVAILGTASAVAQDEQQAPAPQKEHQLLKQFAGEWETHAEMTMVPGEPAIESHGTDSARMLGGFWLVSEMKGECLGETCNAVMTVGYDSQKQKYVGTFVCSMCDLLWEYEGTIDESGKVLTLECEGPDPTTGKVVKMRDVIELKDKDHKTLTSYALGEDGQWHSFMSMTATRKK